MKIIIAQTAGFCMGVKRVVDLALDHASTSREGIYTLGPVIHNNQVIEMLNERGIKPHDGSRRLPAGSPLLIRAHGIAPDIQQQYEVRGHPLIDGTCPKVKTVHRVIEKYRADGFSIVISGDEGHAEVVALLGYAGNAGYLIGSVEDVDRLPMADKICLVSQTTFDRDSFDKIAKRIRERYPEREVVIKKTICSATNQRQEETRKLALQVDAMIVVGGKNSANTKRLAMISRQCGTPTQHVESEADIVWEELSPCDSVGITAGASTPNWMIKRIVEYIHMRERTSRKTAPGYLRNALTACTHLNIVVASGAAALYFVSCALQNLSFRWSEAILAFLYFLSMYLWNSLSSFTMVSHHGMARYQFYSKHRKSLFIIAGACIALLLGFSYLKGGLFFYLILFATIIGSVYHITIVPQWLRGIIPYRNLKDVPTSRDLFVALAWAVLLTFSPHAGHGQLLITLPTILCFLWIFFLAYLRTMIFDLRDIEGDRIMGRETLVTIIGEKRVRRALLILLQTIFIGLLVYPGTLVFMQHRFGATSMAFLLQIPVLFYIYFFTKKSREIGMRHTTVFSLLADGQFFLAGFLAWIAGRISF